jgi:hypothetical protein
MARLLAIAALLAACDDATGVRGSAGGYGPGASSLFDPEDQLAFGIVGAWLACSRAPCLDPELALRFRVDGTWRELLVRERDGARELCDRSSNESRGAYRWDGHALELSSLAGGRYAGSFDLVPPDDSRALLAVGRERFELERVRPPLPPCTAATPVPIP